MFYTHFILFKVEGSSSLSQLSLGKRGGYNLDTSSVHQWPQKDKWNERPQTYTLTHTGKKLIRLFFFFLFFFFFWTVLGYLHREKVKTQRISMAMAPVTVHIFFFFFVHWCAVLFEGVRHFRHSVTQNHQWSVKYLLCRVFMCAARVL